VAEVHIPPGLLPFVSSKISFALIFPPDLIAVNVLERPLNGLGSEGVTTSRNSVNPWL
jgi:hypothetical protein